MSKPEIENWIVHPVNDNHWQAWRGNELMQDNITSANAAWDWIDNYINPVDVSKWGDFVVKNKVR